MYGVHPSFKIKWGEQPPSPRLATQDTPGYLRETPEAIPDEHGRCENVEHPVAQENQTLTLSTKRAPTTVRESGSHYSARRLRSLRMARGISSTGELPKPKMKPGGDTRPR